ncbi:MAG TPA: NAD-dependent deacylase [Anaerolineae bacterium]|nr:NAD-dependent deacylase [Anaerolineae bacterium]
MIPESLVLQATQLLKNAKHTVALTGAGISTPSGIPDFRSRGSGLWERYNPMEVASLSAFRYDPEKFYKWIQPLALTMVRAEPNPAHIALAQLEKAGRLAGIVTQNIDDLHRRAGSEVVYEVHGHLREATCVSCYSCHPTGSFIESFIETGATPHCPDCGGVLKPNIVLFEEQLPHDVFYGATNIISQSDLILVAGSSLEMAPVALLPVGPLNEGARLIIVNHYPTYLDERADVIFRQDVAVVLPHLVSEVLGE